MISIGWLEKEIQKDNFDEFDDTLYLFKGRNLIKILYYYYQRWQVWIKKLQHL